MVLKESVTREQIHECLKEYLDLYEIPNRFRMQYEMVCEEGLDGYMIDSQICQFYKEYNLLKEEADMYKAFVDVIEHNHPDLSNMTILDVAGGMIPQLGRELAKKSKHVMVVDKTLTNKFNPDNLETIKKTITSYKELPKADIVVGLLPCETTHHIIDYASINKKDFIIALCGCIHDPDIAYRIRNRLTSYEDGEKESITMYEKYAYKKVHESKELGELIIYDSPYQFPNDVIGNKRI